MKILLACSQYPPMKTGYAIIASQLARCFTNLGHHVDVITEGKGCYRKGKVAFLDDSGRRTLKENFDLLQIIGPTPLFSEQCVKYAKKENLPIVYQMNAFPGLSSYYHNRGLRIVDSAYKKLNLYRKIRDVDLLIFNTNDFAEYFTRFYDGPFEVIPHGLDPEELSEPFVHSENLESTNTRILFVGQLRRYKGLAYLIKAVRQLKDAGKNVTLDIVGEGPDHEKMAELIFKLNLEDTAFLRGGFSRQELDSIYKQSRVLVLPSIESESFGIVLVEAAARGVRVIASDLPGVREVVSALGGITVPPRDSEALANALDKVLADTSGRSGGTIPIGISQFLWESIAKRYLKSYERVLGIESETAPASTQVETRLEQPELVS
jgi:glycosyltransferase involved in cell wall biosynthesis